MTNDKFREAIDIQLGDLDIKTKDELKTLMRHRKFLTGKTQAKQKNQLDGAWDYLKSKDVYYGYKFKVKPEFVAGKPPLKKGERIIEVKRFKRRQVRNAKGRIVRWE